ncbi:hypothetical protein GCM10017556_44020 [Micromonospora sagamiensis]|uniref:Methyltransferase family protein n=2 Tax=Micromonospora sagamiensis TaxID=47875 RepID=A0A562WK83_9ACTN|nr:hypothetical protein JD81_03845 [Micromonospora sagamiensis]BCL16663.1 hypothetical protein GCM10017556_44020 [Micromonospora sagamiensis]
MGKLHRLDGLVRHVLNQAPCQVFIETGTFHGESLEYAARLPFDRIHSIELSPQLHRAAADRFAYDNRITVHHGDSARVLPEVLAGLHEPALIWLDAHYCFLDSARGPVDCPLLEEVEAIVAHERAAGLEHIVLIDDYHIFGTSPSSPWLVGDDITFVPEADWSDITPERVRAGFCGGKQFHVWADTLFALPTWIQTADVAIPRDPFAEARPVAG